MASIVYVYQNQLQNLIDNNIQETNGVAFEWKGEEVFHVYTQYPEISPSGSPSVCMYRFFEEEKALNECKPLFEQESLRYYNAQNDFNSSIIGIYFCITDNVLLKKGFIRNREGIKDIDIKFVPNKSDLYSRSKGLLETDILEKKHVLIIGLGSFGSQIAVELAKAGVGNFSMIDFDRVELHNIARHICGVNELGRLKTNAVSDAIKLKNPYANTEKTDIDITTNQTLLEEHIKKTDLVICATDNNQSRFLINDLAVKHKRTVLFGRAITRAEGGDVFRLRPEGPCYCCLIGNNWFNTQEEISNLERARETGSIPAYVSENDANAIVQVGLSSDIAPIYNMMVKLSLVELSRDLQSGIASLEEELTFDYYIWANRREKFYDNWGSFNGAGNMPTIMKWYGVKLTKDEECLSCNKSR